MDWLPLLLQGEGIAHSILILALAIALGIQLGKIKLFGISIGMTCVLFVSILLAHAGLTADAHILDFCKDFGLILFVFAVGMQVGPGFFSSFRQGGLTLNLLASSVVLLGAALTLLIHFLSGTPLSTMVGIMSGAVTNTPGLGAAQQAFLDANGHPDDTIALGYAVAYPLGVIGIILTILFVRYAFRVNLRSEAENIAALEAQHTHAATSLSLSVSNPAIFGKSVRQISELLAHSQFVISRVLRNDSQEDLVAGQTVLHEGDKILVIANESDAEVIRTFIGQEIPMTNEDWMTQKHTLFVSRRIIVTKPELNGKRLGDLHLRNLHGVNITRINRSGVDMVAMRGLTLQMGDRLTVVGTEEAVKKAAHALGNSMKRLNEPNLIALFVGIGLGVLLGSIPFHFPGIPQPVKLGLAGGPLIIAILLSSFGYKYRLITYTTQSALLMLREVGISLFLACVGLEAGGTFIDTLLNRGGLLWVVYGAVITVIPLLIVGIVGRLYYKLNYFTLMGLLAGSTTDPPALAYANDTAATDHSSAASPATGIPAISYATVYPLTMFLRVLIAQLLILLFPSL
ncbi:MAG: putative transporter [Tannerellaceae bacterium]|jgi:putative transport protein|nr:putative transporter [Tannerellaceae bacterium]